MKNLIDYIAMQLPCEENFFTQPKTILLRDRFHADGLSLYFALVTLIQGSGYCLPVEDIATVYEVLSTTTHIPEEKVKEIYTYLIDKHFFTVKEGVLTNANLQLSFVLANCKRSTNVHELIAKEHYLLTPEQEKIFEDAVSYSSNSKVSSNTNSTYTNTYYDTKQRTPDAEERKRLQKLRQAFPNLNNKLYGATVPNDDKVYKLITAMKSNEFYKTTHSLDWVLRNCDEIIAKECVQESHVSRESYYAELRTQAENRADKFLQQARRNEAFRQNEQALSQNNYELGVAEAYNSPSVADLTQKRQRLQEERQAILASLHLTEDDLTPHYRCSLCSDTGFRQDGRICHCFEVGV